MARSFDNRDCAGARNRIRVLRTPRLVSPALVWAPLLAVLVASCGVLSPEEQLLTDFFEASRLHDTTIVSRMSSVTFNPRTDGIVQDFELEDATDAGASRRVRVRATVRQSDGVIADRVLTFTLVRKDDRWFITNIDG